MKIFSFLIFWLLLIDLSFAGNSNPSSENEPIFEKLTTRNGRSLGFITGITSCKDNFLWFSTRDGLYKYDGYNCSLFEKESNDSLSSMLSDITYLCSDNTGQLWLRHFDQLGTFLDEKLSINIPISDSGFLFNTKIVHDIDNNYWIGPTRYGIIRYSNHFRTSKIFKCAPGEYNSTFCDLIVTKNGEVCVLYTKGISLFNKQKQGFDFFHADWDQIAHSSLPSEHLTFIHDNKDLYWIGTSSGLIHYNIVSKQGTLYKNIGKDTTLTSNNIICLFSDRNNNLWIGTDNGITILNSAKKSEIIRSNAHNGLYSNYIYTIYQDFSNNIWVGTSEGLNKLKKVVFTEWPLACNIEGDIKTFMEPNQTIWYFNNNNSLIKQNYITGEIERYKICGSGNKIGTNRKEPACNDIIADKGHVWIAIEDLLIGFNKITKKTDKSVKINAVISGVDSVRNKIMNICEDNQGKIWIIALNGITLYDPISNQKLQFVTFNNISGTLCNVDLNYIKGIAKDRRGNIYIRTSNDILQLNTVTKRLNPILTYSHTSDQWIESGNIAADSKGNIWFALLPEIYKYSPDLKRLIKFSIQSDFELSYCNIVPDSSDIWIYSNNGLYSYKVGNGEFKSYYYSDGLPDNIINGLIIDSKHKIWITTSKGLSCFNAKDETFSNYYTHFDVDCYSFKNLPKRQNVTSSEILFFSNNKLIYINADSINKRIPRVVITGIQLFGNTLATDSLVYHKKFLHLKYNQNFLTFTFSALDYTSPEKNKYAFKLEGIDKEWKYTDASNREANYTSLPPGRYTFIVKACNSDQVWNKQGTRLSILISPPWYRTKLAYVLYVSFGLLAIYLVIRFREQRLIKEKQILEQKVTERTHTISQQNKEITAQRDHISQQNKNVTDSIVYAKRIQSALLPPENIFGHSFSDSLVLYLPRDIVSGDFYWHAEKGGEIVVAVADCTGHGVPGAFMSMLGISVLTDIISKIDHLKACDILEQLRNKIISLLHESDDPSSSKDGMDISVCIYNQENNILQFSGAYNSLYLVKNNEFIEIKADRQPIGYYDNPNPFTNHELQISKGDVFYMLSDGYADQFHYKLNEKFKSRRLREMLKEIHTLSLEQQREILLGTITEWIGTGEQLDDITIVGIRV